jgi:hypothetical protein
LSAGRRRKIDFTNFLKVVRSFSPRVKISF